MKHLYLSLIFLVSGWIAYPANTTIQTMEVDGFERTAIIHTPSNSTKQKMPLLLFLHPNGYSAAEFSELLNLPQLCDAREAVVVVPEALDEQNSEILKLFNLAQTVGFEMPGFSLTYVWNAGARVPVTELTSQLPSSYAGMLPLLFPDIAKSGYIRFNKDVDDVKFLNLLLDQVISKHSIDTDQLFVLGASMGGAMTYKYALSPDTKAKAIVVICGFLGGDVELNGDLNMPLMAVHSKDDEIVAFNGGMLDIAVPERINSFAEGNSCNEATQTIIDDIANDSITIVRYDYDCQYDKRVRFFELTGAKHASFLVSDYQKGPNDIDFVYEANSFLFGTETGVEDNLTNNFYFYPNPANEEIYVSLVGKYSITTLEGATVQSGISDGSAINIANLAQGIYLFTINNYVAKLVKK